MFRFSGTILKYFSKVLVMEAVLLGFFTLKSHAKNDFRSSDFVLNYGPGPGAGSFFFFFAVPVLCLERTMT